MCETVAVGVIETTMAMEEGTCDTAHRLQLYSKEVTSHALLGSSGNGNGKRPVLSGKTQVLSRKRPVLSSLGVCSGVRSTTDRPPVIPVAIGLGYPGMLVSSFPRLHHSYLIIFPIVI